MAEFMNGYFDVHFVGSVRENMKGYSSDSESMDDDIFG